MILQILLFLKVFSKSLFLLFKAIWRYRNLWFIVYRKTDGLVVDCYVLLLFKGFKQHFNLSHVTKVSAQTITRGYKKRIQLGKTLYRFPDFINRKYFTLILKTMILTALVNFVTSTEIFKIQKQPPEMFLEDLWQGLFFDKVAGLRPANLFEKPTPAQVFSGELC